MNKKLRFLYIKMFFFGKIFQFLAMKNQKPGSRSGNVSGSDSAWTLNAGS
jgi:hypothetical protein